MVPTTKVSYSYCHVYSCVVRTFAVGIEDGDILYQPPPVWTTTAMHILFSFIMTRPGQPFKDTSITR